MKSKHHCRYCESEMRVTDEAYAENPFCAACLDERTAKAVAEGPRLLGWQLDGDYMIPIREER